MSNKRGLSIPRYIALRYVSVGKRSHLVSFMSAMSIFGLALSMAILIAVLSVLNGFDREMRENVLGIIPHLTITNNENPSAQQWQLLQQVLDEYPQVVAYEPAIQTPGVIASSSGNSGVLVTGIDAGQESRISVIDRFIVEGALSDLDEQRWGIVIGASLAQSLGKSVGDTVDLFSLDVSVNPLTPLPSFRKFTIVALFRVGTQELDANMVMANLSAVKALYRVRGPYTALRVKLVDVLAADAVSSELAAQLTNDFEVISWSRLLGNVYENIRFSRTIIGFMLWILIAVAAFNLVVSLIMIVRDKTADIAILRTLGASPTMINRIFMWQGCFIGLIGTFLGVVIGIFLSLQVSDFALALENRLGIKLLNADVYPIDFLPSQILVSDVLMVSSGVLALSLLATVYPARRAAAIQPAKALRND